MYHVGVDSHNCTPVLLDTVIEDIINKVIEFVCYYEKNGIDTLLFSNKLWHSLIKEKEDSDGNNICRLNSKDINFPLYFRNRKNGDYIILKNSNVKKKILSVVNEPLSMA